MTIDRIESTNEELDSCRNKLNRSQPVCMCVCVYDLVFFVLAKRCGGFACHNKQLYGVVVCLLTHTLVGVWKWVGEERRSLTPKT